ncbi:hypothetical protein DKX38_000033 [Salix brachista]|uniref:Uncharacterized protein n=1 Tax=Salix brachista TaxID=2182728 RepID=A0A5N5P0D3_9ROSI|nr:hypothetical protein DKX38_000033 [Salix brachista]
MTIYCQSPWGTSIFLTWMEQREEINSEMRGLILRNSSFISPWHETRRECIREWGGNSSEKQEGQQQVEPTRGHSATHSSPGVRKGGGARDNHSSSATEVLVDNLNGACAYLSFYPRLLDRVCLVNALG